MEYTLSNGERVNLYGNFNTAKFLAFKYPTLGATFVGATPHITATPAVIKLYQIAKKISETPDDLTKMRELTPDEKFALAFGYGDHRRGEYDGSDNGFDDDIPF